ncbi:MAG: hypothetical protein DHS20C19_12170 [Acidimicrobiales bacterium]|nr:MAG: hypothetical protein DHS20C19_12170 [Acidimicrobiales bacterium]
MTVAPNPVLPQRVVVAGEASGAVLALDEPLSFWGGLSAEDGRVIDEHHPQVGACVTGTVLVMRSGRGSSSASTVLAEMARLGTAPAAIVMIDADEILATGSIVADELYGRAVPIVLVPEADYPAITAATTATLTLDGALTLT